jgi:putative component of membrane protein insertase Oxa1/YidC/SpoIIIJ protein YidD
MRPFTFLGILFFSYHLIGQVGQDLKNEISFFSTFYKNTTLSENKRNVSYVFRDKKWIIKYNPVFIVFGGALYVYQKNISPILQFGCLYEPSCSEFSRLSIREYGLLKGILMSGDRLTRCTRISIPDIHPLFFLKEKYIDAPSFYK